jgi:hypothetical protein
VSANAQLFNTPPVNKLLFLLLLLLLPTRIGLQGWSRLDTCDNCAGTSISALLSGDLWLSDPTTFINRLDPNTGITMQQVAVRGSPENCCECQTTTQSD